MLMVIFGAGASYDSDPSRPASVAPAVAVASMVLDPADDTRPPLAGQLFDKRGVFVAALSSFPECSPIIPFLRSAQNIEQQLEQLQNEATEPPAYVQRLPQLAAVRHYLQASISIIDEQWNANGAHGITNYVTLLDEILRWGHSDVLLVTLNYDRLLEWAVAATTGQRFDTIDDYVAAQPFRVIKLHGSVDWGRVVKETPQDPSDTWRDVRRLIAAAGSVEMTSEYVLANTARPMARDATGRLLVVPAIAIPVQSKQQFECPEKHLEFLRECLPKVRHVLVIGWRGMDQHFTKLLKTALPPDVVVQVVCNGGEESKEVAARLAEALRGKYEPLGHGFTRYVVERIGRDFFRDAARELEP